MIKVVWRSNMIVRGNLLRQQELASSPLVSCHFSNTGELRDTNSATQGIKHQASISKRQTVSIKQTRKLTISWAVIHNADNNKNIVTQLFQA